MKGLNRPLSPDKGIKILGERNSGTNFLERLLQENCPSVHLFDNIPMLPNELTRPYPDGFFPRVESNGSHEAIMDHYHREQRPESGGWKHAAPDDRLVNDFLVPTGAAVIVILRHPASWVRSMHRNPFHTLCYVPDDLSEFIRQPWITAERDGLTRRLLPDLPSLLRDKVDRYAWLLDAYPNSTLVRYEDLALAPIETLRAIGLPIGDNPQVPEEDPRWFAKAQDQGASFASRAKGVSYASLERRDQKFLRGHLKGSVLSKLYPK